MRYGWVVLLVLVPSAALAQEADEVDVGDEPAAPQPPEDDAGAGAGDANGATMVSEESGELSSIAGRRHAESEARGAGAPQVSAGGAVPQSYVSVETGTAEQRIQGGVAARFGPHVLTLELESGRTSGSSGDILDTSGGLFEGARIGVSYSWNGFYHYPPRNERARITDQELQCLCAEQGTDDSTAKRPFRHAARSRRACESVLGRRLADWHPSADSANGRFCAYDGLNDARQAELGGFYTPWIFTIGASVAGRRIEYLDLSADMLEPEESTAVGARLHVGAAWLADHNVALYLRLTGESAINGGRTREEVCQQVQNPVTGEPPLLRCAEAYTTPLGTNWRASANVGLRAWLERWLGIAVDADVRLYDEAVPDRAVPRFQFEAPLFFLIGDDDSRLLFGARPRLTVAWDTDTAAYETDALFSLFVGGTFQTVPF